MLYSYKYNKRNMKPASNPTIQIAEATRPANLDFQPITLNDLPRIYAILRNNTTRSCDFTLGGIYMWIDYFGYEYAIVDNTLFIKGLSEDAARQTSFTVPVGRMPLSEAVETVRRYCRANNLEPLFSAVPESMVEPLQQLGATAVSELPDWADYIYNASDLATLTGKRYNKKRNHVNRFMADNPDWHLDMIDDTNLDELSAFFSTLDIESAKADPAMAEFERQQTAEVIRNYHRYPFVGGILRDQHGSIVAFTIGEIYGDTLILHIEKMRHDVAGAGESINKLFAAEMLRQRPELRYINREDDAGDPGLRYAKESYHPAYLLKKFNVMM